MTVSEWRRSSRGTLLLCVLTGTVGLTGACQNSTIVEDTRATAIVTGTVTSRSGGLPTLTVQAAAYTPSPSCSSGTAIGGGSAVAVPPGGGFTLDVVSLEPAQAVCVIVFAEVTINGQRDSVAAAPVSMMLRDDNGPLDSVHVNLVFP